MTLQCTSGPADSSARAHSGDEDVHVAFSVTPDLFSRSPLMYCRVGGIDELAENHRSGSGVPELFRLADGSFHTFRARGENEFRPKGLEQAASFLAHGLRHRQDYPVALRGTYPCQTDTRVAACRLYDCGALAKDSLFFSVLDHCKGHAVLDASARVEILKLQNNGAQLSFKSGHPQKRGVAD